MKRILFVCTGNTCRSPMAAALLNKLLKDGGIGGFRADSAGLAAIPGSGASQNAILAAKELGIDLSNHRAKQVSRQLLLECDRTYTMSQAHKEAMLRAVPQLQSRIHVLGGGIPDPYGGDLKIYRHCRDQILAALKKLTWELKRDG